MLCIEAGEARALEGGNELLHAAQGRLEGVRVRVRVRARVRVRVRASNASQFLTRDQRNWVAVPDSNSSPSPSPSPAPSPSPNPNPGGRTEDCATR